MGRDHLNSRSSYIGSTGAQLGLFGFAAAIAFLVDGSYVLSGVSVFVGVINQFLAHRFWAFARDEARFRVYAQAQARQNLMEDDPGFAKLREFLLHNPGHLYYSPELQSRLDDIPISIIPQDGEGVPDWIMSFNIIAVLISFALLVWGIIAAFA